MKFFQGNEKKIGGGHIKNLITSDQEHIRSSNFQEKFNIFF
jgi:hypothetical protein